MYSSRELFILMNMYHLFYNIKFLKIYKGEGTVSSIGCIVKKEKIKKVARCKLQKQSAGQLVVSRWSLVFSPEKMRVINVLDSRLLGNDPSEIRFNRASI